MFRYGILSSATIVERFVAGINESKDGYVQAIASRSLKKAQETAKRLKIEQYYGSYDELFNDENIDIIYIPTINSRHYQDCKQALLHHKHVIMEKPFTLSSLEAKELFALAKANNCLLMEGQKAVFLPATNKVKELINNNTIGKVKYIEFKASFKGPQDKKHWMYDLSAGGGTLYPSANYTIEYLQHLFDPDSLKISGNCLRNETGIDEISNFQIIIDDKIIASSTIAMNLTLQNETVFYGEFGYIIVPNYWKANQFDLYLYDGTCQHFDFSYQSEFVYEIEHFHQCLKQRTESSIMTKEKTIQTVELVEQLQQEWQKV